jgi:hypothetical protein
MGNKMGGAIFKGDKGKLLCESHSGAPRLIPQSFNRSYQRPPKSIPRVEGHHQEWIQACKNGTQPSSNFEVAGLLTQIALLGNVALHATLGKRFLWDPVNLRFTNDEKANNLLHYEYRAGWNL